MIHVESPVKRQFSLGEVFTEWQVNLSADNIGALRAVDGKAVRVFVNGAQQTGDPAAIMLGGLAVPTTTELFGWRSTFLVPGGVGALVAVSGLAGLLGPVERKNAWARLVSFPPWE